MDLHWKLFEQLFSAHSKRRAIARVTRLKEAIITGIWGNPNYDAQKEGQQSPREKLITEIEDKFQMIIDEINGDKGEMKSEIDQDDPFFAAMQVPDIDFGDDAEEIAQKREQQARLGYVPEYDQA